MRIVLASTLAAAWFFAPSVAFMPPEAPKPVGRLIAVGGQRIHLHCTGSGAPTVVIETGLGDFSFDWELVQQRVESRSRVCTYDRGGYAWSDPGAEPRTFDQLNLELHDTLARAEERGPYVLVGHSYGGGVVRSYAARYPGEVAGVVLVESIGDSQFIPMGPRHAGRIRDDARGVPIPAPQRVTQPVARDAGGAGVPAASSVAAPYDRLGPGAQRLHAWASVGAALERAEASQRQWSAEYYARWAAEPATASLGTRPLVVLTRARGGYPETLDVPAAELERTRLAAQQALAALSSRGSQQIVNAGHNMHLEVPDIVVGAIRRVTDAAKMKN
jgi:pimeloyl-ACP methyl ester carboxylesterase